MRALAADTARALATALEGVARRRSAPAPAALVGRRAHRRHLEREPRARRRKPPPALLVTTPESLSLMLSRHDARRPSPRLRCVVVDEWHELIGNKRGVQTQLALARLRAWRPDLDGLGPVGDARQSRRRRCARCSGPRARRQGALVEGRLDKALVIDTLLPAAPERFPWAGHLGAQDGCAQVVAEIERSANTLVFTNTRSQAEILVPGAAAAARPDWAGVIALHHGSLDARDARMGRARPQERRAEGGRLHLEPRSRRRFPAGRARAADRLAQGRRAALAARRAQRPCAGPRLAHHDRAEPQPRTHRGGRGQVRDRAKARSRAGASPGRAARRARAASA